MKTDKKNKLSKEDIDLLCQIKEELISQQSVSSSALAHRFAVDEERVVRLLGHLIYDGIALKAEDDTYVVPGVDDLFHVRTGDSRILGRFESFDSAWRSCCNGGLDESADRRGDFIFYKNKCLARYGALLQKPYVREYTLAVRTDEAEQEPSSDAPKEEPKEAKQDKEEKPLPKGKVKIVVKGLTYIVDQSTVDEVEAMIAAFANSIDYGLYEKIRDESDGDGLTFSASINVNIEAGTVNVVTTGSIKVKGKGSSPIKDSNQSEFDFDEE